MSVRAYPVSPSLFHVGEQSRGGAASVRVRTQSLERAPERSNYALRGPARGAQDSREQHNSTRLADYLSGSPPEIVLDKLIAQIEVSRAEVIGVGQFGDVISARTRREGQQVAIKMLPFTQCSDEAERIRQEVESMHNLSGHPNLIRFIGVLMCNQMPLVSTSRKGPFVCIVMDMVADSQPLSVHIKLICDLFAGCTPFRTSTVDAFAGHVVGSVASALHFMHNKGYVHRDVWAENILVSESGKIVLCDLGCAQRYDAAKNQRIALNIPYMSPAAWQGKKQAPCDDCWSLGLVLSEIVTGKMMFHRLSGVTTKPVHKDASALERIIQETSNRCPSLGLLCKQMIEEYLTISMGDVSDELLLQYAECPVIPIVKRDSSPSAVASTQAPSSASDLLSDKMSTEAGSSTVCPTSQRATPSVHLPSHVTPVCESISLRKPAAAMLCSPRLAGSLVVPSASIATSCPENASHAFTLGQRVKYLARSNGAWYPGVIHTRLSAGWVVSLDCGEIKEVGDRESFRLQKEG